MKLHLGNRAGRLELGIFNIRHSHHWFTETACIGLLVSGLGVLAISAGGVNRNAGIADFGTSTAQPEMNSVAADPTTATTAVMNLAL